LLASQPGFAEHFLPHQRAPRVGEHFVLPGAARALRRIADSHGADFYCGEIATALAAHARTHGGVLTERDLADYFTHANGYGAQWVEPIRQQYRLHDGTRFDLHEIPPNGQGIAALMALGIVQELPLFREALDSHGVDSAEVQHLLIEAMKLAFADTYAHVADPGSMPWPAAKLLDPDYLTQRARLIDPARAQAFSTGRSPQGGTVYLAAADEQGMMVSFIQSNYMGFGSGVVVPGWGISLQNRGHCFSMQAGHPNEVGPGKRPFHTIIPAFLTQHIAGHDVPQMSFGVMGGNMQPQGHLQTLVRILGASQQPQAACDAPRWKWNSGLGLEIEAGTSPSVAKGLARRGHVIQSGDDSYMDFGAGQFIWSLGSPQRDGYVAASDSRRDGMAAGY
jgi:gamma-glutamyltranspeptidase/glutathione hydrolase